MKQTNLKKTKLIFWVSLFASIACFVGGYAISPEQVAIHFGVDGSVNNTASSFNLLLIWLAVILFAVIPLYILAISMNKLPEDSINLPNKAFWFSEENKAETLSKIEAHLLTFASATALFFASISALVTIANQSTPAQLNAVWFGILTISFVAYIAFWLYRLIMTFTLPQK